MSIDIKNPHNHGVFRNNIISVLALFCIVALFFSLFFSQNSQSVASDLTIGNIIIAVNHERILRNQPAYITNSKLSAAAQIKATDMIARNYFSHTDPDGNYIWPTIVAQGYSPYLQLGENLAIDFYNTESLVAAWMNSPTHRANLLNGGFEDQGMGLDFGDISSSQHYSSIANTFGALIKQQQADPPPTAETQTPQVESETIQSPQQEQPKNSTPPPQEETEVLIEEEKNEPQTGSQVALRGSAKQEPSFTTEPAEAQKISTSTKAAPPVVAAELPKINFNPLKFNRYFALIFGGLLLIILILDARDLIRKKISPLDKKVNNIIILILALIIIAVMYWL